MDRTVNSVLSFWWETRRERVVCCKSKKQNVKILDKRISVWVRCMYLQPDITTLLSVVWQAAMYIKGRLMQEHAFLRQFNSLYRYKPKKGFFSISCLCVCCFCWCVRWTCIDKMASIGLVSSFPVCFILFCPWYYIKVKDICWQTIIKNKPLWFSFGKLNLSKYLHL